MTRGMQFDELATGQSIELPFSVTDACQEAFGKLSGDHNPIHLDDGYAQAHGMEGRVVYGGVLLAQVSRLLGMCLPGRFGVWTGIRMHFRAPLYLGENATLTAVVSFISVATRTVELRLEIATGEKLVATGRAEATYHRE